MPFFGVLPQDGEEPCPADTVEYSQVEQLYAWVTRVIAPRGRARVDSWDRRLGAWAHAYEQEIVLGESVPRAPFAIYLTGADERYRLLVFDLDAKGPADAQVWTDASVLEELLEAAGLRYVIARSGPGGGLHFWVAVPGGVDKELVRALARAAAARLPRLDVSPLMNARTGCARPPGAPHREGGFSCLLYPATVAEAAGVLRRGNSAEGVERLARLLGADDAPGPPLAEAVRRPVVRAGGDVRIVGSRREPGAAVQQLLRQPPPPGQGHAVVASIFTRLALARWSLGDVEALVAANPQAPGLEHLRSQGHRASGRRTPRGREQAAAVVRRQWDRCVSFAATLPPRRHAPGPSGDSEQVVALCRRVEEVLAAVDDPRWWSRQAGPSDRKAVLFVALCTLDALAEEVQVDCRRAALNTGMGRSTVCRAHERLIADRRLERTALGEGQIPHTYRLTSPAIWQSAKGGTQASPRPPSGVVRSREDLRAELRRRLQITGHEAWTEPYRGEPAGLGRHVALTYWALRERTDQAREPYNVRELSETTGYGPRTIRRHLDQLARHRLAEPEVGRWRVGPADLDAVAARLGVAGTAARRAATYAAERDAYDWWIAELDWLRSPKRHRRRAGPGGRRADASDEQIRIVDPALPAWSRRARYPRTVDRRPDHAAARQRMLARHGAAPTTTATSRIPAVA